MEPSQPFSEQPNGEGGPVPPTPAHLHHTTHAGVHTSSAYASPDWSSPAPVVPASPQPAGLSSDAVPTRPVPVVRVLSPVGVEYVFMTFTLFAGAIALASALIALVNGKTDFSVLSFPAATLVVCVPVFAFFFLRLKKLELAQPELRLDASKRRSTQFIQITTFGASLFTLIGLVFAIFAKLGGQSPLSIPKALLDSVCVLVVAGGILAYYWRDEHKGR